MPVRACVVLVLLFLSHSAAFAHDTFTYRHGKIVIESNVIELFEDAGGTRLSRRMVPGRELTQALEEVKRVMPEGQGKVQAKFILIRNAIRSDRAELHWYDQPTEDSSPDSPTFGRKRVFKRFAIPRAVTPDDEQSYFLGLEAQEEKWSDTLRFLTGLLTELVRGTDPALQSDRGLDQEIVALQSELCELSDLFSTLTGDPGSVAKLSRRLRLLQAATAKAPRACPTLLGAIGGMPHSDRYLIYLRSALELRSLKETFRMVIGENP